MEGAVDAPATDGGGVNKKLMRLSVDTRANAKRSSILFDNALPIASQTETLLKNDEDQSPSGQIRINRFHYSDSRFPRMEEMSHFHYNHVEFPGPVQFTLSQEQGSGAEEDEETATAWMVEVTSADKVWTVKRTHADIVALDRQIHRCVFDRGYSHLESLSDATQGELTTESITRKLESYLQRLTAILSSNMNCGPVLNWFELDNHGNHLVVMEADDSALNVPAIAAAKVTKRYIAQAPDEISLEVNEFVSVIDMPPNAETVWWRGKKGLEVGFFPSHCVELLIQKDISKTTMPRAMTINQRPVTKRRGKFISFLRNFFRSRPSKDELMQTGILRERVFGCDLGEHLTNTGKEIPLVLEMCSSIIEEFGIVDGIYRLSGITSNMQRLRVAFDNEDPPKLTDPKYLNDVHCISSLLKTYFRELPNPLMTYELYDRFVGAMAKDDNTERTIAFHHAIQRLPPPHYRTLEYLLRHLSKVAGYHKETNMNVKNLAIVWSPNLLKPDVQEFGQRMLSEIRVQALIMEYLLKNVDLFFDKNIASAAIAYYPEEVVESGQPQEVPIEMNGEGREIWLSENMAITTTPPKLISLEEARARMREKKEPLESNGVPLDEEDGGAGKVRHKVKPLVMPPQLASFPVSEGPSLLTIEEAQARNRSRSAKIPRRGSVDLVEFRLKAEKDGPLVPPSPSPKKRLWKMIFARSKSSSEYQEATATMPKTASLSNYRKRNDSASSLHGRSFSSYNLGDYVRSGSTSSYSFLDQLSVGFSARNKRVEISDPIPHRTESFTSYVGGSDLLYIDGETAESATDTKVPQKRPSRTSRTSFDRVDGRSPVEGSGSPFLRKSKRKDSGISNRSTSRDFALTPESPSSIRTISTPSPSGARAHENSPSFSVRSTTSPARISRRKGKQPERTEEEPIWIRASKHYQADLLPKDKVDDYLEKENIKPADVKPMDTGHLREESVTVTVEQNRPKETTPESQSFLVRSSVPISTHVGQTEETRTNTGTIQGNNQLNTVVQKDDVVSWQSKHVRPSTLDIHPITYSEQVKEPVIEKSPETESSEVFREEEPLQTCAETSLNSQSILSDTRKTVPHSEAMFDRLVERTSYDSPGLRPDPPDVMSTFSKPNPPTTWTYVSTSELPTPQVAVRSSSISDKLVNETAQFLEERRRQRGLVAPLSSSTYKRHSYGGSAIVPASVNVGAPMTRHESLSFVSGESRKNGLSETSQNAKGSEPVTLRLRQIETTDLRAQEEGMSNKGGESGHSVTLNENRDLDKWHTSIRVNQRNPSLRRESSQSLKSILVDERYQTKSTTASIDGAESVGAKLQTTASTVVRSRPVLPQSLHRPLSEKSYNLVTQEETLLAPSFKANNTTSQSIENRTGLGSRTLTMPSRLGSIPSSDSLVSKTVEKVNRMSQGTTTLRERTLEEERLDDVFLLAEKRFSEANSSSLSPEFTTEPKKGGADRDRARKIRDSLLSRGSRELESHSTLRSRLPQKAVSSDDVRSMREGQFLRGRVVGRSIDLFEKSPAVTSRRISIGDPAAHHPLEKERAQDTLGSEVILRPSGARGERFAKSDSFDWVPVMQQSLSGPAPPRYSSSTSVDDRATFPGRRPSAYDNVVAKRRSFYDNFQMEDV